MSVDSSLRRAGAGVRASQPGPARASLADVSMRADGTKTDDNTSRHALAAGKQT